MLNFNDLASKDITRRDIDYVCDHESSQLWILHGKPLPMQKNLSSISFDPATGKITFFGKDNEFCSIPVPVKDPLVVPFSKADKVTVVWTSKGEIHDLHILPLKSV